MAGDCGSCTMCCKIMAVDELAKPKFEWCKHCDVGVGCKIYHDKDKPESCDAFKCLWLQTQGAGPGVALPAAMRPDRSKVVLHMTPDNKGIVAKTDPANPLAWAENLMAQFLGTMSETVPVLVDTGKRYWSIEKRAIREVRMSKADAAGIEHFEGYV